jgi:tetratricopeptide (TPR) repeat protein
MTKIIPIIDEDVIRRESLRDINRKLDVKDYTSLTVPQMFEADKKYQFCLEEQLKNNPKDTTTLIQLGVLAFICTHNHQRALDYLKKVIELDPQNTNAYFWLATCLYHDYCEYNKAEKVTLEALKIDQTRSDCLCLMGLIYWHSYENIKEGIKYLEKAIHYEPNWPMLRHLVATLYLEIHDTQSAEAHVQQAFKLFSPLIKRPTNAVENYYENVVTGRSWINLQKEFQNLIEEIDKMQSK